MVLLLWSNIYTNFTPMPSIMKQKMDDIPCESRSLEFCRVLIEKYPGSEQIANSNGAWPLHCACLNGTVAVVEYLYKLYPSAINHATTEGHFPIHYAIAGTKCRVNPAAAVDVVNSLLDCDPNVKLQKYQGRQLLLHFACVEEYDAVCLTGN
jgi:hypothetical protein